MTRQAGFARVFGLAALGGVAVILAALLVAGCGPSGGSGGGSGGSGDSAPDFQVTTFAGEQVSLSLFRGRPLVLAFMASW